MTIPPVTSDSSTPEVQQAVLFKKQILLQQQQQEQLIESANSASNIPLSETVGQNLNVKA